ncbi:hypothetical protein LXL04_038161 [Taraxacum kok-saghyz]
MEGGCNGGRKKLRPVFTEVQNVNQTRSSNEPKQRRRRRKILVDGAGALLEVDGAEASPEVACIGGLRRIRRSKGNRQRGSVPAKSATFSLPSHSPGIGVHSMETYDPNLKISQSNLADSDSLAIKLSPDWNGNPFPKAELIDNSQFESSLYTDSINRVAKLTRKLVISDSLEPLSDRVIY